MNHPCMANSQAFLRAYMRCQCRSPRPLNLYLSRWPWGYHRVIPRVVDCPRPRGPQPNNCISMNTLTFPMLLEHLLATTNARVCAETSRASRKPRACHVPASSCPCPSPHRFFGERRLETVLTDTGSCLEDVERLLEDGWRMLVKCGKYWIRERCFVDLRRCQESFGNRLASLEGDG